MYHNLHHLIDSSIVFYIYTLCEEGEAEFMIWNISIIRHEIQIYNLGLHEQVFVIALDQLVLDIELLTSICS